MRKPLACLTLALLAGCGYHARFQLPPHLQTFSVNTFRNKTLERNLDFEFTEAIIHEILAKTDLRVAKPGEADLEISGEIERLERHVQRSKRYAEKMEMRYVLTVNIEMLDTRKNVTFFQGSRLAEWGDISLNLGQTPREARDRLVRELARHVVSLAFEPWPPKPPEPEADGG